jgi:hypothetical protein
MRNFTFFTLILVVFVCLTTNAQTVEQKWLLRFHSPAPSTAGPVTTDASGNIYYSYAQGGTLYLNKLRPDGSTVWTYGYRGPLKESAEAIAMKVDGAGNVYIVGISFPSPMPNDILTMKFSNAGVLMWARTYNGPANSTDQGTSVAVDAAGNVYAVGEVTVPDPNTPGGGHDIGTIKYSSDGVEQWVRLYNGTYIDAVGPYNGLDIPAGVGVDKLGNVYVGGTSEGQLRSVYTNLDFAVVKYNSSGTLLWEARYNTVGNGRQTMRAMAVDASGNSYVTGEFYLPKFNQDILTVKINSNGKVVWTSTYDGLNRLSDHSFDITLDPSGNPIVVGETSSRGAFDYITLKYSGSLGTQTWVREYDGGAAKDDRAVAVKTDVQGSIYVTGYIRPTNQDLDVATLKYSSTGTRQWVIKYASIIFQGLDIAKGIAVYQPTGPVFKPAVVYVAANSPSSITDAILIKYEQPQVVGGAQVVDEVPGPGRFSLNNYPNPFRNSTTINYSIPEDSYVSIIVYDGLGRRVKQLVSGNQNAGVYNHIFTSGNLSAGVYHYRIIANTGKKNFEQTKMMVIDRR